MCGSFLFFNFYLGGYPWPRVLSLPEQFVGDPASLALDNIITYKALNSPCALCASHGLFTAEYIIVELIYHFVLQEIASNSQSDCKSCPSNTITDGDGKTNQTDCCKFSHRTVFSHNKKI